MQSLRFRALRGASALLFVGGLAAPATRLAAQQPTPAEAENAATPAAPARVVKRPGNA